MDMCPFCLFIWLLFCYVCVFVVVVCVGGGGGGGDHVFYNKGMPL